MTTPSHDDLAALRDELRAEISEARGTLKDLRYEIREARQIRAGLTHEIEAARGAIPLFVAEHVQAEVEKQIKALGKVTERAMRDSVEQVSAEFGELHDILTGQTAEDRAKGNIPIPELIRQYAARRRQDRTSP